MVCTQLPAEGTSALIEEALTHFRALKIRKISWLAQEGGPATEIKKVLLAHGLTFSESYSIEMAADLRVLPKGLPWPMGLKIVPVEDRETLRQWIHVASISFDVREEFEPVWYNFFADAVFDMPFRGYLALWNGEPVATSQLFLSAGVVGVYNVTCLLQARRHGIGTMIARAPLLEERGLGYAVAILQGSHLGYPVYSRLGFQDFAKLSVYLWENEIDREG